MSNIGVGSNAPFRRRGGCGFADVWRVRCGDVASAMRLCGAVERCGGVAQGIVWWEIGWKLGVLSSYRHFFLVYRGRSRELTTAGASVL